MASDEPDDEYVANLLKQDAKSAAKKYELVGIDAFNPKRSRSGAPKPNTNFLRHIIRQTDSHNAALLAKEAEESQARLKEMNGGKAKGRGERASRTRGAGRLTPVNLSDDDARYKKRRKLDSSDGHDGRDGMRSRKHREDRELYRSRRDDKDETQHRKRERRRSRDSDDNERSRRRSKHSRHHRDRDRRSEYSSDEEVERSHRKERSIDRHRRRRSRSRSTSRTRSPPHRSSRHHKSSKHRRRSHSPKQSARDLERHSTRGNTTKGKEAQEKAPPSAYDSDPLEAIVGPLPPPAQPAVRARGRGALKANSMGMDARFSSTYDPSADVQLNSDAEDEWGDALEALRDRQLWKSRGAERLKAAGFSDEQVKKWEKGDALSGDDVVWAPKGQAREWDRGKVVDDDGDVDLKADWGRLK